MSMLKVEIDPDEGTIRYALPPHPLLPHVVNGADDGGMGQRVQQRQRHSRRDPFKGEDLDPGDDIWSLVILVELRRRREEAYGWEERVWC